MNTAAKWHIGVTALLGVLASATLYAFDPFFAREHVVTVAVLCSLALTAEALMLLMPNSVSGSIAFIPYLTAAFIAPNWLSLAGVVAVRVMMEILGSRPFGTRLHNVGQQAVTFACAVLAFRLLGGRSFADLDHLSVSRVTLINGIPVLVAIGVSFGVNSGLVLGFQAAKSNKKFLDLWRGTYLSTIGLDILATPVVFIFAWVYVNYGGFAAAGLWVPVLGLRQLQKNNLDLERTNSELLELMVKSMEARDPYTSGHSRRVQQFSLAIAKGLGLPQADVERVGRAALLHDVGKIHEKYAPVLRKPGNLSPEEWQIMQLHPSDGAELVSTMSRLHDIVPAIKHHHERWDGTGYPEGLAGETIPRASRIIAFADTIDAMTSERPYRKPLTESEVRAELVRCRGTQFDPAITDHILSSPIWRSLFPPSSSERPTPAAISLVLPKTTGLKSRAG